MSRSHRNHDPSRNKIHIRSGVPHRSSRRYQFHLTADIHSYEDRSAVSADQSVNLACMLAKDLGLLQSCLMCVPSEKSTPPPPPPSSAKALYNNNKHGRPRRKSDMQRVHYSVEVQALPPHHKKGVSFGSVEIREFNRIAGDHPDCRTGPPMSIDWKYVERDPISVNHYEQSRKRKGVFAMDGALRKEILKFGFHVPDNDLKAAEKEASRAARKRDSTRRRHQFQRYSRRLFRRATAPFRRHQRRRKRRRRHNARQ